MATVQESTATLRLCGDDLVPAEVSKLLGCAPSQSQSKGEIIVGPRTGIERVARVGMWRLECDEEEPANLNRQIHALLSKLTDDMDVWVALRGRYEIDLFCGLFMGKSNEGLSISALSLTALGQRGIELSLDIYEPSSE